jgi:hypothetical protein
MCRRRNGVHSKHEDNPNALLEQRRHALSFDNSNIHTASWGTVEANTTAHIPAPTRIGPILPAEGSGNVVWSSTTRWLTLCYLLLLVVKIIDERLTI